MLGISLSSPLKRSTASIFLCIQSLKRTNSPIFISFGVQKQRHFEYRTFSCFYSQIQNIRKFSSLIKELTIIKEVDYKTMADNRYSCDYAKRNTSACKKCKAKIDKGELRLAKLVANPFSDGGGDMKQYFHPSCIFETFVRARATTKKIEEPDDLEGFSDLTDADKNIIKNHINDLMVKINSSPKKKLAAKSKQTPSKPTKTDAAVPSTSLGKPSHESVEKMNPAALNEANEKDNSFRLYRQLCANIADESSYIGKTRIVSDYLTKGNSGNGFKGDTHLLLKLLLPGAVKRVYNINSKQLVKLFSQIFGEDQSAMLDDLDNGDVAETIKVFFEKSTNIQCAKKSFLSIQDVDKILDEMSNVTKEDDQQRVLTSMAKRSTANDLKMIIRLIKHDLRINAGAKHILEGLDPNAYDAFQASRNLKDVVDRVLYNRQEANGRHGLVKKLSVKASLMTPILPMLAEACKSIDYAMKKCPNGMYSEIKYDGERVQVHKNGDSFQYFSRSLKPVLPHKVAHFKDWIPKAFPGASDLILDAEVLLIDTNTGKPLPFGTLGVHKKQAFKDANVCLFVFDCVHYNGENLLNKPIKQRREILQKNMVEIPNRILFSEMEFINDPETLADMMMKVFREGLEGLVLKDINGIYEPGKRHWLKVKKDYLAQGAMADSADLVVLGAYYGTGNKGGIMSVFLMGVYDPDQDIWCTVTKVASGYDDATLDKINKTLKMDKISKESSKVPKWLKLTKGLVPDFVASDPKDTAVWEVTGAEFTASDAHTAGGISIRFPRVTKFRDDKSWKEATDLPRLKVLFKKSKETTDLPNALGYKGKGKRPKEKNNSSESSPSPSPSPLKVSLSPGPSEKRNKNYTPNGSPTKKIKYNHDESNDGKPECKYGATCYQTNADHLANFTHPLKTAASFKSKRSFDKSESNKEKNANFDINPMIDSCLAVQ
ncbi:DNA ligase 3-like isoform X2 [Tubulanus polymorphus]|uniref:DNA ligase 3-like isoform X2 n=2 Tax=Tubulanus polymorphus TaxID=672921 RepID=UPI003DA46029